MITTAPFSDEFVGRREELEFLLEEFRNACDGRARCVPIEGDAGIGKSRLVREFLDRIGDDASVVVGHCVEQIRKPYLPIESLLERFIRRPRPPERDGARGEEKAAFFEAVLDLLRRESTRKPIVLAIEDVHWADDASLELLRYLASGLGEARVLILLTLRTAGAASNAALAELRLAIARSRNTTISLYGLRRNDIKNLVQRISRARYAEIPPEVVAQIEGLCDGNPLFAEELARIAIETGGISLVAHVPLSVQAMLSERLTTISEGERAILVRAAIVGQVFNVDFVADVADVPVVDVLATVQRAAERDVVVGVPGRERDYAFRHALIRQALSDQLILGLAAPLHLRIAEAIENGNDAEARVAELAYHYSQARVAEKARRYDEQAAEAARAVYAYRDAIRFYVEALAWDYPAGPQRAAIYQRLGTLLYIDGVGEEPARWFERSRDEYERLGNAIGRAQALLLIADQRWVDARTPESLRAAAEAASHLERLGQTQFAAAAMLSIARFAVTLGNPVQASAHVRALGKLRAQFDVGTRASFHEVRAEMRAALGDASGALADGRRAARLAAQTGDSELIAQIENNVALVAADLGELELAVGHHRIALGEARRTGMMWRVAYCALNFAQTLLWRGELREARAQVIDALECGVTTATFRTRAASVGIPLGLMLNDRALIQACSDEVALEFADRSREIQRIGSVGAAFAELRAAQGALDEAQDILGRSIGAIGHTHRSWNLWLQIGQWGRPEDVALARSVLAGSRGRPRMLRAYGLLLSALSIRTLDPERARRRACVAARMFEAMGFRWNAAFALELGGRTDEAREKFRELGAVRDCERLSVQSLPLRRPSELTARQAQVAELIAQGQSNRDIAAILHISEHTVEHHVSTLFARLGVKSRTQLTAFVLAKRD